MAQCCAMTALPLSVEYLRELCIFIKREVKIIRHGFWSASILLRVVFCISVTLMVKQILQKTRQEMVKWSIKKKWNEVLVVVREV